MPTWVKCTTLQDDPILVYLDNASTLQRNTKVIPNYAGSGILDRSSAPEAGFGPVVDVALADSHIAGALK